MIELTIATLTLIGVAITAMVVNLKIGAAKMEEIKKMDGAEKCKDLI